MGFYLDGRDKVASEFLSAILTNDNFRGVPLSSDIAVSSAIIRANTRLKLLDAMVLATAVQLRADFLISNDEGFPKVHQNVSHVRSKEMSGRLK
ncbi:MAG: type II toxin-antitoxin system VapC family toxin [Thermoplasmataceae archaeon]